jgi:uncharacterized protein YegP (UPF0339 family)
MSKFEICTDESGKMIWELKTKNDQVVAKGGEKKQTKVHPKLGVRFAKMVAQDAKVTECER